jgi:uncharacterized membrane protein YqjE
MGLLQSTQALLANVLGLARTRLDLLSTELQEVLARLVLLMVGAVAAILLAALAFGFGAAALLMAVPEQYRVWVAAGLAVAFLAGALFLGRQVQREAKSMPFAASIAELQRDLEALNARE